jgi:hypothetical protein
MVPVPDGTVILSEVMPAPDEGEPEWVELRNTGAHPVSLYGYRLIDAGGAGSGTPAAGAYIRENGFAVLATGPVPFNLPADAVSFTVPLPPLNNDGDGLVLLNGAGIAVDSMRYGQAARGISRELISPAMRGSGDGWDDCVDPDGGTPGAPNSIGFPSGVADGEPVRAAELTATPNPFGDRTDIAYRLPFPLARVRLFVYDRGGRLVARVRDVEESGSEWAGTWDGRGEGGRLPAGPYILNLEALDKRSGRVHTERMVVVVGARL